MRRNGWSSNLVRRKKKFMKAEELDKRFDNEENVIEYFDLNKKSRPGLTSKKINIEVPSWMLISLDKEAKKIGVTRQSIIKLWIAEKLKRKAV